MTLQEAKTLDGVAAKVDMMHELLKELRDIVKEMPDKYATKSEVNEVKKSVEAIKPGWPPAVTFILSTLVGFTMWLWNKAFSGK